MKAIFKEIKFNKEIQTKFGPQQQFTVKFNGKTGSFLSKYNPQKTFKEGVENEFTMTEKKVGDITYYNIRAIKQQGTSNFARNIKKEQSKYSGFAMSYAKDLVTSGMIPHEQMYVEAEGMFKWMVEKDKEIANG